MMVDCWSNSNLLVCAWVEGTIHCGLAFKPEGGWFTVLSLICVRDFPTD